jgi:hypothetical protein
MRNRVPSVARDICLKGRVPEAMLFHPCRQGRTAPWGGRCKFELTFPHRQPIRPPSAASFSRSGSVRYFTPVKKLSLPGILRILGLVCPAPSRARPAISVAARQTGREGPLPHGSCTFAAIAAAPAEECRLLLTRSSPRGECMTPPGLPPLADIPLHTVENPQRAPVDSPGSERVA